MKSGASSVKSALSSISRVQKHADTLAGVDELVSKLDETYISEEATKRSELRTVKLSDFHMKATLGTGSFGRVRLVRHSKHGERVYALKMLSKALVLRTKQLEHVMSEKRLLTKISFPFIINLYGSFQDEKYLYLVLEYSIGGEFFTHLRNAGKFSNDTARFFASQVLVALEYLHGHDIVYRDLKPENLLLDSKGNIKMCDFGFAKVLQPGTNTWTLCGTPEYLAPEIILNKGHGKAVDWWALGVLIYEMLAGYPPFYADDRMQMYKIILAGKLVFPTSTSKESRDLISKLLTQDLSRRLGNLRGGGRDIRAHSWFANVDWAAVVRYVSADDNNKKEMLMIAKKMYCMKNMYCMRHALRHAGRSCKIQSPIKITAKATDDTSNFDEYGDDEGPDVHAGGVQPEQQKLFDKF